MEIAFRVEKQRNIELREKIRANEQEHQSIIRELKILNSNKDVTYVSKNGNLISLTKIEMSIDDLV